MMSKLKWIIVLACGIAGCKQGHKDSIAQADSINMTKDSGDATHPGSVGQEISGDDAKFAAKAAAGGLEEVELGKLAEQKGSSRQVRDFGAMMVKDHSAANTELVELTKSKRIVVPVQISDDAARLKKELSAKSGQEFDKAYVKAMIDDHKEDTAEFARAIKVVKYPEMLTFAKKTLPILKMHLATVEKIQSSQK